MSLKEITKDLHHEAETTQFAKLLLSGNISKEEYANYLYQMLQIYRPIELGATTQGFFDNMAGVSRDQAIYQDFIEIMDPNAHYVGNNSTMGYHNYLIMLLNDPKRKHLIKAHLYVRHMGDLYGGQIVKKQVAHISSGKFYEFENSDNLKASIRELLTDLTEELGNEAKVAFEWAIRIMKDLKNERI
jgi:heme oxygenase